MFLDLPTLMVMGSFVSACSGVILLGAWLGNQKTPVLGLWGIAGLISAGGIMSLMLGVARDEPLIMVAGNILLAFAHGLMWKAAHAFGGKAAAPVMAVLGALILALVSAVPTAQNLIAPLGLLINAGYLYAGASAFWAARKPPLPARWPLAIVIAVHATILLIGAISTFTGAPMQIPPLTSLFGMVHFESIVFSIGTTTLVLALVKERSEAASKFIASIDSLTGVANRAAFMSSAEKALEHCQHDGVPVSVIMFDLDLFKAVNDSHGHATGDAVIRKFSEVAVSAIRHHDVFGRIGGEEFTMVLPRSNIEAAYVRADSIRLAFAASCRMIPGHQVDATVSGGVSASVNAETTLSILLEQADEALYRAKAAGRNRVMRAVQPDADPASSSIIRAA